ncbi:Leucine-rich repeat transmembrane protein kinase [Rhynchospora pubera]|uniref:non-specific serine/threonine protein kinase n=1 Tax=Rhynchospora pubera TaxID=906938 RepID=A0AAV8CJB5_9POAL|nr:Leucine-rich repeat transmembrane protein kinase [Rhynchospora pubera]
MKESSFVLLVVFFVAAFWVASIHCATQNATKLHPSEKKVLMVIARKLGKKNWDFSVDPCSGKGNFMVPNSPKGSESSLNCTCAGSNSSFCHVSVLWLKGENLTGILPPELSQLPYLEQLDLSRNVLTGSVPTEWSNMKLHILSLMGNKLSGPFPLVLTKITTLNNLSLEANNFQGPIPTDIGNLVNLQQLHLTSNKFTGELPSTLTKLTNLTDLRISSNNFSGRIPDFLKKMTKLEKLHMQGCLMKGPIPRGISQLKRLTDLRISDLRGNASTISFPDLSGMESMNKLILRNCSILGSISPYIGEMKKLKHLDLSFNKLSGEIPTSSLDFAKVDFIFLTGNMLTGQIPPWVLTRLKVVDISYNNFTVGSGPTQCFERGSINAVESYSSEADKMPKVAPCLKRNFPCASNGKYSYALHINCGGKEVTINGTKFEADTEAKGASTLYLDPKQNWAFSSSGNFMDNSVNADTYIVTNESKITMPNSELYMSARLSPLSLTYYGLCMYPGSYTVQLHFSEVVFVGNNTYSSLGERLFNVFIQGNLVLEEFNIAKSAGGPGKAVIKNFTTYVTDHTLEIRFYWAGRGTTSIPDRGFYGPLISAISVTPNFEPPPEPGRRAPLLVVIGVPVLAFSVMLLAIVICWRRRERNKSMYKDLRALDLQVGSFTLRQIKAATKNFDIANKVGEGGFGSVYKGLLSDGTVIAVKQLSSRSKQGNREFVNEIGMISGLRHANLVRLYGCCTEGNQLCLVYEYMENNCLARVLFGTDEKLRLKLDWGMRQKICLDIARGLAYLHEESTIKIVHRDIKASNILLDKDLNAKISDFGLAKLNEDDHTHISTRIAGTIGYMAPEYAMRGYLTNKADIYSFGIVALEIVSGKSNTNYRPKDEFVYLLDWACVLQERGTLLELVDPSLGQEFSKEEALLMLNVALLCTNASPTLRPNMSQVVSLLEGHAPLQPLLSNVSLTAKSAIDMGPVGVRRNFWQINSNESQSLTLSELCPDSSESLAETVLLVSWMILVPWIGTFLVNIVYIPEK